MRTIEHGFLALVAMLVVALASLAEAQTPTPLVPTPVSVVPSGRAVLRTCTGGASIVAGDALYMDTDNTCKLAIATGGATSARLLGIAINNGASGQKISYDAWDPALVTGFAVAVGELYVVSGVAGRISDVGGLASGSTTSIVGIGQTATTIFLNPINSGQTQ
jgi:hypothetical protein